MSGLFPASASWSTPSTSVGIRSWGFGLLRFSRISAIDICTGSFTRVSTRASTGADSLGFGIITPLSYYFVLLRQNCKQEQNKKAQTTEAITLMLGAAPGLRSRCYYCEVG